MDAWVIFRRARTALFCLLVLTSLAWATLFAVFLFYEWSHFSKFQRILVASLLSLYGFTAILVYLMVVIHFRLWWDVARSFALLVVHLGSSVLFTIYSPSFPCLGFGSETTCKKFVHAIFIGCWALSGIILFFVIALGVMVFIPQPVESLQGAEEIDVPFSPASFKAGSPTDEERMSAFYSVDSRTGFVTYNNGGNSAHCVPSPVNSAYGGIITMGPPRPRQGFESPNPRHKNNTYGATASMRNAPTEHVSGPRRVDTLHHNPLGNPSPPSASIYSRAAMTRPGVGGKNSSVSENRLNQSSAFHGLNLKRDALSPISLRGAPPPVTTQRNLATEYTPTLYPASPGDHSQREQTYLDHARFSTPSIYSFHSSAASVHPTWVEPTPTPHIPPLPVRTPDIGRFQGSTPYSGAKEPSSGNNPLFATSILNAPLTPKLSEPRRNMQHYGTLGAHQPYHPPVKENSFSRRDSNGQVLDQKQWRRLVLNAAARP